ncbi:MAG: dihydroorotate dehydrogenase electron transfer subunit [Methanobacteriota archaeon]
MQAAKIKKIIQETPRIKTFMFDMEVDATPGQFGMFWIPGLDEKPMSLSHTSGLLGVTVLKLGPFSSKMHKMKEGDLLGVRAPLGKGFNVHGKKILVVGGGSGIAPLAPLAEKALKEGKRVTAIVGALTKAELLFVDRMRNAGAEVLIATDDGTAGTKGFTTDVLREVLKEKSFDQCFTCGPEIMMLKVLQQAKEKDIPTQVSLHRYIKCGIGICGHCVMDETGFRVCKEGPTFRDKEMEKTIEFGKYWRNASCTKIYFGGKK